MLPYFVQITICINFHLY